MRFTVTGTAALAAVVALGVGLSPAGASPGAPRADQRKDGVSSAPGVVSGSRSATGAVPAEVFSRAKAGARVAGARPAGDRPTSGRAETTVIVQLTSDPLAVRTASAGRAATTPRAATTRRAASAELRAQQRAVTGRVEALGGTVLGGYQTVYNGLKLRIRLDRLGDLRALPGVAAVHPVQPVRMQNTDGVPAIGAPDTWGNGLTGLHGEGVRIAIVDSGIDYTHADFGGPGTPAAYQAARATGTQPAPSTLVGPDAPKVKGGTDLVGDAYHPDPESPRYDPVPRPDPNPLDCNGHGTHVAGTAAGFGVLSDGRTYRGRYNAYTQAGQNWQVGPGVAPKAELYAVRVVGCAGGTTTDVLVDALEWAVEHDMDVINVSLGNPYGTRDAPESVAADNATKAGVIVVAAAGDEGDSSRSWYGPEPAAPYLVQTPAAADGAISVAAADTEREFPGARVTLNTGASGTVIVANAADLPGPLPGPLPGSLPVVVLMDDDGAWSGDCDSVLRPDLAGALVVWRPRPGCTAAEVVVRAQRAGAAAVYIDDEDARYLGTITQDPADGSDVDVTIPVLAAHDPGFDYPVLANATSAALTPTTIQNPRYQQVWARSSSGPRYGDSRLKPDITAPGVAISSAGSGSGTGASVLSGTSMATAFVSGLAALVKQAHPGWTSAVDLRSAVVEGAHPVKVPDYRARRAGTGLAQALPATRTQAVAVGSNGASALNYGFAELLADHDATRTLTVRNHGDTGVTFAVRPSAPLGRPHTLTVQPGTVFVPAHGSATVTARLRVPARTAGSDSSDDPFATVYGLVTLSPLDGGNAGAVLRVPYFFVPKASSHVTASLDTEELVREGWTRGRTANVGVATGFSQWYVWGLRDDDEPDNRVTDVAAAGVLVPSPARYAELAIAFRQRMSNAASAEYYVYLDLDRDGTDDQVLIGLDLGALLTGRRTGVMASAICDLSAPVCPDGNRVDDWLNYGGVQADTSVVTLLAANQGWSVTGPFSYRVAVHGLFGRPDDVVAGSAVVDADHPALIANADAVRPQRFGAVLAEFDAGNWGRTPALGFMIVTRQNQAQAQVRYLAVDPSAP